MVSTKEVILQKKEGLAMDFTSPVAVSASVEMVLGGFTTSRDELLDAMRNVRDAIAAQSGAKYTYSIKAKCLDLEISLALPYDLSISVEPKRGKEYIVLESAGKRGRILRENGLGIFAQCDESWKGPKPAQLTVDLSPGAFDRALDIYVFQSKFWITTGKPGGLFLRLLNWLDPEVTPETLVGFIELAEKRAQEVVGKILAS